MRLAAKSHPHTEHERLLFLGATKHERGLKHTLHGALKMYKAYIRIEKSSYAVPGCTIVNEMTMMHYNVKVLNTRSDFRTNIGQPLEVVLISFSVLTFARILDFRAK